MEPATRWYHRIRDHGVAFLLGELKTGRMDAGFHRWLLNGFDLRARSDFDAGPAPSMEAAARVLSQARVFIGAARLILEAGDRPPAGTA